MYYTAKELKKFGVKTIGKFVKISNLVKFYNFKGSIGDNSRIDDYVILKGNINIGKHVHISSFCILTAPNVKSSITIGDFSGISAHTSIYAVTDDFTKSFLVNPTVKKNYTKPQLGHIKIGKCCLIGLKSTLLPKCNLKDFVSISANSVVNEKIDTGNLLIQRAKNKLIKTKDIKKLKRLIKNYKH